MGMWRSGLTRAGPGRGGAKGKDREGAGARGGGEGGIRGGGLGVRCRCGGGGKAGGRRLAPRRWPRREGAGLSGSLALRHRLRATAQVAGRWRGSGGGRTRLFRERRAAVVCPPPTPMYRRGSLRTLPSSMHNLRARPGPGADGGRGKTDTCLFWKELVWAVREQGAYLPGLTSPGYSPGERRF